MEHEWIVNHDGETSRRRWPFAQMEIGDYFRYPVDNGNARRVQQMISSRCFNHKLQLPGKFTTRHEEGAIVCERVK